MFKNIQKQLLIKYPLLWNTRVVPVSILLIAVNIIFFVIGYVEGKLNFSEDENNYNYDNDGLIIFFSSFLSIIIIILWLIFYLKNNSFKSFYPKNNFSLLKEWLIILLVSFLTCLFTYSFYYGKETRIRSYYSEKEAKERCEILSKASFFIDGSFSNNYRNDEYDEAGITTVIPEDSIASKNNFIYFNGKKYNYLSLLNKNINSYTFFDFESDSVRKKTIKTWLVNQQKDSIKNLFNNYLKIAKEHNLKANIDANKWFDLIYDHPNFDKYNLIGKNNESEVYYANNYTNGSVFDSVNKYIVTIKDQQFEYYKYYVPESKLNYNYDKIANSWNRPSINFDTLLIILYIALGLSLLVFSFRVTSIKNWMIAAVGLGILGILFGIISLIIKWDYTFPTLVIITVIFAVVYFIYILTKKKNKSISGVVVNVILWSVPGILPLIYFLYLEFLRSLTYQDNVPYELSEYYPTIKFLKDNSIIFLYLNILFVLIMMLVLSSKIKKWRGLAEN